MHRIIKLTGPDRVRCRPAVIFGSNNADGVINAFEMLLNTLSSECIAGFSNKMIITQFLDDAISIQDFGRGLFLGNDDNCIWQDLFCEISPGSAYDDTESDRCSLFSSPDEHNTPVHRESLELCAVQYASEYMTVSVQRDGIQSDLRFKRGQNIGGITRTPCAKGSCTLIKFKPDPEVFTDISIPTERLLDIAKANAILIPGANIVFRKETVNGFEETVFCFPSGVSEYLEKEAAFSPASPIFSVSLEAEGQERYNRPKYTAKIRLSLYFTSATVKQEYYHNRKKIDGGSHIDALKEDICQYLEWMIETPFCKNQILSHLRLVVITDSTCTHWESGTRRAINNTMIRDMAQDLLDNDFRHFIKMNRNILTSILKDPTDSPQ